MNKEIGECRFFVSPSCLPARKMVQCGGFKEKCIFPAFYQEKEKKIVPTIFEEDMHPYWLTRGRWIRLI